MTTPKITITSDRGYGKKEHDFVSPVTIQFVDTESMDYSNKESYMIFEYVEGEIPRFPEDPLAIRKIKIRMDSYSALQLAEGVVAALKRLYTPSLQGICRY